MLVYLASKEMLDDVYLEIMADPWYPAIAVQSAETKFQAVILPLGPAG